MTYSEREAIFSKEALNGEDIMKLFGVCRTEATKIMQQIKHKTGDRLGVQGRIHVQDYLDYFALSPERYGGDRLAPTQITEAVKNEAKKNSCEDEVPLIRSSKLLHNA